MYHCINLMRDKLNGACNGAALTNIEMYADLYDTGIYNSTSIPISTYMKCFPATETFIYRMTQCYTYFRFVAGALLNLFTSYQRARQSLYIASSKFLRIFKFFKNILNFFNLSQAVNFKKFQKKLKNILKTLKKL